MKKKIIQSNKEKLVKQPQTTKCNASKENLIYDIKNIAKWNIDLTVRWLKSINYEDCDKYFIEHKINGRALLMLNEDDLKEIIKHNVGQRKNLYHLIKILQIKYNRYKNKQRSSNIFSNSEDEAEAQGSDIIDDLTQLDEFKEMNSTNENLKDNEINNSENHISYDSTSLSANKNGPVKKAAKKNTSSIVNRQLINDDLILSGKNVESKAEKSFSKLNFEHDDDDDDDNYDIDENMPNFCENCLKKFDYSPYTNYGQNSMDNIQIKSYKGEKRKTFVSLIYLFLTCLWTAFMLTVVHDR